jgi:hypothetical protein
MQESSAAVEMKVFFQNRPVSLRINTCFGVWMPFTFVALSRVGNSLAVL